MTSSEASIFIKAEAYRGAAINFDAYELPQVRPYPRPALPLPCPFAVLCTAPLLSGGLLIVRYVCLIVQWATW